MDKDYLKKFVNRVFTKNGYPSVKKFAAEFADGGKFKTKIVISKIHYFIHIYSSVLAIIQLGLR